MSEISRQEKLASAKRKLKLFQQKRSQFDTDPPPGQVGSLSLSSYSLGSSQSSPSTPQKSPVRTSTPQKSPVQSHAPASQFQYAEPKQRDTSSHENSGDLNFIAKEEDRSMSAADKIKEISNQLNGLMSQDGHSNGENPIVKDIQAFEARNSELEASLVSSKRSNRQLSEQVNHQRKQIIQLQEQVKQQELNDSSTKKFQEQKGLKEQLEVHIQTIGILVSEKTELQTNVTAMQKKFQTKENETQELSSRLTAVRQRVVELERIESNLQLACDKQTQYCRSLSNERDMLNGKLSAISLKTEEFSHQNSELLLKLQSKIKDCEEKDKALTDALSKLNNADHHIQQLASADGNSSDGFIQQIEVLRRERDDVHRMLADQQKVAKDLQSEKTTSEEHYTEERDYYANQIKSLQSKIQSIAGENNKLLDEKSSLAEVVTSLKAQLEKNAAESKIIETESPVANAEIKKLDEEKNKIEKELDIQIAENRRLTLIAGEADERIEELESMVSRLGEEAVDKMSLLESIQSDKETISRATQQNKQLKDHLEELQNAFVKMTNTNAELTAKVQKQQHEAQQIEAQAMEAQEKLSLSLEEIKDKETQLTNLRSVQMTSEASPAGLNSAELQREVDVLKNQLNYQIELNDKLQHMEARAELTDRLQTELHSAQQTINNMSSQNSMLKDALSKTNNIITQDETSAVDGPTSAAPQPRGHETKTPHTMQREEHSFGSESDGSVTDESRSNVDESEMLQEYKEELQHLQSLLQKCALERDTATRRLDLERKQSQEDFNKLREHLNLQLQQQLQQQQRQVQEHFHEQLHEQQRKMKMLQETLDTRKRLGQGDVEGNELEDDNLPYDTLKTAFQQLQSRFRKIMDDKAAMIEKLQDMEHTNLQLASETETIGEYITLYQTQRQALRDKFTEKERLVIQLSKEHARMQSKVSQLQRLVTEVLAEKSGSEQQTRYLQELVNQRLTLQSDDGKHDTEVPKLNYSADTSVPKTMDVSDDSRASSRSVSVSESLESDSVLLNDTDVFKQTGKAQQILQILEQLETTGEGYQKGWVAPNVRKKEFTPCKHCSRRVTVI